MDREHLSAIGLIAYGTGLISLYLVQWTGGMPESAFRTGPFLLIAGAVLYSGVWLVRNRTYLPQANWILAWTVGGGLTFGAIATLVVMNHWLEMATTTATVRTIFDTVTGGSLAGTVAGLYDAQSRQRNTVLEEERDRIERFAHKAESLNRYATALNEATHIDEVSALALEVVQLLVGSREGAFFAISDGEATVKDSTLSSAGRFNDLVCEVAESTPMEAVRVSEEDSNDLPGDERNRSIVAIPVPAGPNRTVVLLAILKTDDSYFDEDVELLELLASHMRTILPDIDSRPMNPSVSGSR